MITAIDWVGSSKTSWRNLTGGSPALSSAQRRRGLGNCQRAAPDCHSAAACEPRSSAPLVLARSPPPAAIGWSPRRSRGPSPGERRLTLFYTAEVHGTLEPCGCTSDPLGDVARYAALVRDGRAHGPGRCWSTRAGCRSPRARSAKEKAANDLRARRSWARRCRRSAAFAAGLAETDVGAGRGEVAPRAAGGELLAGRAAVVAVASSRRSAACGSGSSASPIRRSRRGSARTAEDPVPAAKREVGRAARRRAPSW